jgi:hypothetical protein
MKHPSQPNITNGSGRTADRAPPSAPGSRRPTLGRSPRKQNPGETAQEAVHQVMPKDAVKTPSTVKDAVNPPLRAARGDDDLMSQPVKRT